MNPAPKGSSGPAGAAGCATLQAARRSSTTERAIGKPIARNRTERSDGRLSNERNLFLRNDYNNRNGANRVSLSQQHLSGIFKLKNGGTANNNGPIPSVTFSSDLTGTR